MKVSSTTPAAMNLSFLFSSCTSKTCGDFDPIPGYSPKVSSVWIDKGQHENSYAHFKATVEAATDFSWFSSSDTVLLNWH